MEWAKLCEDEHNPVRLLKKKIDHYQVNDQEYFLLLLLILIILPQSY